MRRGWIYLPLLGLAAGCGGRLGGHPSEPAAARPPAASSPAAPAASPTPTPTPVDFATQVRPILEEKCSPCHFSGGRMYERLPFDKEGTIRVLGDALFTRLSDPVDQELVRRFLYPDTPP